MLEYDQRETRFSQKTKYMGTFPTKHVQQKTRDNLW